MVDKCIPCMKKCRECKNSYITTIWCGNLLCNKCLEMCWIVNDKDIMDSMFECCPLHRPLITDLLIEDRVPQHIKEHRRKEEKKSIVNLVPQSNPINIPVNLNNNESSSDYFKPIKTFTGSLKQFLFSGSNSAKDNGTTSVPIPKPVQKK
jgi:hypothetical protein